MNPAAATDVEPVDMTQDALNNEESEVSSPLRQFCDYTTAHGLGRFGAQGSTIGRTIWLCFLLGTYGGFTYHMYSLGQQFASVPLATSLATNLPFEFPDVYFCPSDVVTMSRLSPQVEISKFTRALSCDQSCQKSLKYDSYLNNESGFYPSYGESASALMQVTAEVEYNITQMLHYGNLKGGSTCRITSEGEEYTGNLSVVPIYSSSFLSMPMYMSDGLKMAPPGTQPYVTHRQCIGWNEAARELKAAGVALPDRILALGYSDSERSCRQPPGLPLTAFHDNATRPLQNYIGCVDDNATFEYVCLQDKLGVLTLELCMECCYNKNYSYMGLQDNKCQCTRELDNVTTRSDSLCSTKCRGSNSDTCGGSATVSVYEVRNPDYMPLFIPFRTSIGSFKVGPYCFYRDSDSNLAATYCNVPYCPISRDFDCLLSEPDGVINNVSYLSYTGYRNVSKTRDKCLNWDALKAFKFYGFNFDVPMQIVLVVDVHIETPDYSSPMTDNFCRTARVMLDAVVMDDISYEFSFLRTTLTNSKQPVCPIAVTSWDIIFSPCNVDTCTAVSGMVPGLVRDSMGSALLASRFGSSIGIGFTGCSFGNLLCTMEDFTTIHHPEFGLCHRFNQQKWVALTGDLKATDAGLTFSYFTDSTDTFGRQLPGLGRMSSVVFPGLVNNNDGTLSALKVVVVPPGQFPWQAEAVTVNPGQHLELRMRYDKATRYSKPPEYECSQAVNPVTYRLPSWHNSWSYMKSYS